MIETEDYWIVENKFIFKPEFNSSIKVYNDLLSQYDILIFSDYDDVNIWIDTNNKKYYNYYRRSKFNTKIELPEKLTYLTFGCNFNRQVELPENLTLINFGHWFNQEVKLPENLTHLTFGYCFNQEVELPLSIIYLSLDCNNEKIIDYLHHGIEELELKEHFKLELNNLPNSIKKIVFKNKNYNCKLNNLHP